MKLLKIISIVTALSAFGGQAALAQQSTMTQGDMNHSDMDHSNMDHGQMDHGQMDHGEMDHSQMDHGEHDHNHPDVPQDTALSAPIAADAPVIVAQVNGLVCDFCAQALKKVFKKEDAVESLDVDLDAGEIRIALKDGETLSDDRVEKLIRKSGYALVSTTREGGA